MREHLKTWNKSIGAMPLCYLTCMFCLYCVQVLLSSLLSYSDVMGAGVARWSSGCHGAISSRIFRDGLGIGQVVQNSFIIWFEALLKCHLRNTGNLMFLSHCGWPWQPCKSDDTLYSLCYIHALVQIYRYLKDGLLVIATNVLTEEQALTSVPFNANLK